MTALGAGLLVGAALAVIIPEGVNALYMPREPSAELLAAHAADPHAGHDHGNDGSITSRFRNFFAPDDPQAAAEAKQNRRGQQLLPWVAERQDNAQQDAVVPLVPQADPSIGGQRRLQAAAEEHNHNHEDEACPHPSHSGIGASLIFGFILMLLIDRISSGSGHGHSHGLPSSSSNNNEKSVTTTVGLVVHAAADGIALGAAVASQRSSVEMLVFLAIMLHKAPSAFGLTSFLVHEGFDNRRVRKHLLIFSCSAPIGSIVTYLFLRMGGNTLLQMDPSTATGYALLFSAGTFVYVATMHVLPEIMHVHPASTSASNASGSGDGSLSRDQFCALIVGMVAPLFMSIGHSH
ncbi:solute carrier family 39, variant [Capsaspora owczarzaki ATCC 30864]|nr:solute carrier family 39, variant [Capsaspora owczarzaki ATCC 30864]